LVFIYYFWFLIIISSRSEILEFRTIPAFSEMISTSLTLTRVSVYSTVSSWVQEKISSLYHFSTIFLFSIFLSFLHKPKRFPISQIPNLFQNPFSSTLFHLKISSPNLHLTPPLGRPWLVKWHLMLPHLHKTPSLPSQLHLLHKSQIIYKLSITFPFSFSSLPQRNPLLQNPPSSQHPPPTSRASSRSSSPPQASTRSSSSTSIKLLPLDWGSSLSSSDLSPWIKLHITNPSEYSYSPRLVSFLVYLYPPILCSYAIKITFLDHQTQPANSVLRSVFDQF